MLAVTVKGGTNAGRRIARDRPSWCCRCTTMNALTNGVAQRVHPGDRYSCPDCGARRPS